MASSKKPYLGIREIARLAGVSTATVSRVINTPEATAPATREKVLKIIEEYNYVPNQAAKNLFAGTSNAIAIFVQDMRNPYYVALVSEMNRICLANGYMLIICDTGDDLETEKKYHEYCQSIRCSGIFYTSGTIREPSNIPSNSIPLVLFDREPFPEHDCYCLLNNHEEAIRILVDHLYKLGHRKIGFIGGPERLLSSRERHAGFRRRMQHYGLEMPEEYFTAGEFDEQTGVDAFDYFYSLADAPTAIVAANDQLARGFVGRALSIGLRIPEEFSICGVDAVDIIHAYPPITSIRQDPRAVAEAAFHFITHTDTIPAPQEKIMDVSLFIGTTTCRCRD